MFSYDVDGAEVSREKPVGAASAPRRWAEENTPGRLATQTRHRATLPSALALQKASDVCCNGEDIVVLRDAGLVKAYGDIAAAVGAVGAARVPALQPFIIRVCAHQHLQ